MSATNLATAEHSIVPATTAARREPRIPRKVRHACNLLADGEVKTVKAAAERAGLSREYLSRTLSKGHVQAFLTRESAKTIAGASLRASRRLVELIDAESEHVAAKVSERILTSEGILKSDQPHVSVNANLNVGFIVDLREPAVDDEPYAPDQGQAVDITAERSSR